MNSFHFPIKDKWIPKSMNSVMETCLYIAHHLLLGHKVVVHCNGGKGRAATVVTSVLMLIWKIKEKKAIAMVRSVRPGTIRNPLQITYLQALLKKHGYLHDKALKMSQEIRTLDPPPPFFSTQELRALRPKKSKKTKSSKSSSSSSSSSSTSSTPGSSSSTAVSLSDSVLSESESASDDDDFRSPETTIEETESDVASSYHSANS